MTDQIKIASLPKTMTAEAFSQLPETSLPIELINGEVIVSPTPKDQHQHILGELYTLIKSLMPGGVVRMAPLDVYLDDHNVVQPDLFWISTQNERCQLIEGYWHGAPDLVVEILSPSTARRDKTAKFDLYEAHGVGEYWMVEPVAEYVEVWCLEAEAYTRQGVWGPGDHFSSSVLGNQMVEVGMLFQS